MERKKALLISLSFIALALAAGCSQGAAPPACSSVVQGRLANCIYVNAVMGQNPFYCYSLQDTSQRALCLKDSSDPAAKASLQKLPLQQRDSIFAGEQAQQAPGAAPGQPAANESPSQPLQPQGCDALAGAGRDDCLRSNAVQGRDLAGCEAVSDTTTRQNCITQIAKMVKNPSICAALSNKDDIDLCSLYAKAGEG